MDTLTDTRQRPDARLLVVEDEPNILELLSASLRYAGFDVVTAAAGTEAVQAASRRRGADTGRLPDRPRRHRG
jgi:DNA-binding response OmpR family regulator